MKAIRVDDGLYRLVAVSARPNEPYGETLRRLLGMPPDRGRAKKDARRKRMAKRAMHAIMTGAALIVALARPAGAEEVARTAASHIGRGETAADNVGPWVRRYLRTDRPLPWCAGFVSHVLEEAGRNAPYTLSSREFLRIGRRVADPAPGDVAVYWRGARRGPFGHAAVVEAVRGGTVTVIEGNRGGYPAVVRRRSYARAAEGAEKLLGYVRI